MDDSRTDTACCGLYCRDCIPSNRRLFALVGGLEAEPAALHFEEYAAHKAKGDAVFNDYAAFLKVLRAIRGLECTAPCRVSGGKQACTVRECVMGRRLSGCWDCAEYRTREILGPLRRFHSNLERHLYLIRQEGIDAWSVKRKGHYPRL